MNKYKKHGHDGLIDSRGRSKPTAILTDKERLNVENKALKARKEYLEMENNALKKLHEEKAYKVTWLCQALKVSRSGYYKWLNRQPSQTELRLE